MSGFRPAPADRTLVAIGAVGQALFLVAVGATFGLDAPWLGFLGIPGGVAIGAITRPYGPALRNGLYVAGLGLPLAVVLASVGGFALSVMMGFGLDSTVSFGITVYTAALAAVMGPFHAITGAIAADRTNRLRVWVATTA